MVNINYQAYGGRNKFKLRLRFYENGETRYIAVTPMLRGELKHSDWNANKKKFRRSAPYSEENNEFLESFMEKYIEIARGWKGTLDTLVHSFDKENNREGYNRPPQKIPLESDAERTFEWMVQFIVNRMKRNNVNPDGTVSEGYTMYEKMEKKMKAFCQSRGIDYRNLLLKEFTPNFINAFFRFVALNSRGRCIYASQGLHATLNTASKYGLYDIGKVEMCDWIKKNSRSSRKYETLTEEQCKMLAEMPVEKLPKGEHSELYRDFCLFITYTCQSPCDAISLKYSDIQNINGQDYFVFKRRKIAAKQSTDCSVPINHVVRSIMEKWESASSDGYIFPIRTKAKLNHIVENSDIKHFVKKMNVWLKKVGVLLGCKFKLHSYVFRHTGITRYISAKVPITFVANLAGTSVQNIEHIYYNNHGDTASRDMVLNAVI